MKPKYLKLLLLFLLLTISLLLLRSAGTYLVKQDTLHKSDAALILMGSIADRVLQAADVYREKSTEQLIIVNNIQYGSEFLADHGVNIPNFAQLSEQALVQLGIPDTLITILPGRAASTREEAEVTAAWLIQNPDIDTLVIVSSAAHMRRSFMIFKNCFNDHKLNVTIVSVPSKYSGFNAQKWWTNRESAKQVFLEYTKILSFLLVERWR